MPFFPPHLPSIQACEAGVFTAMNQRHDRASQRSDGILPVYLSNYNTKAVIAPVNHSGKFQQTNITAPGRRQKTQVTKADDGEDTMKSHEEYY